MSENNISTDPAEDLEDTFAPFTEEVNALEWTEPVVTPEKFLISTAEQILVLASRDIYHPLYEHFVEKVNRDFSAFSITYKSLHPDAHPWLVAYSAVKMTEAIYAWIEPMEVPGIKAVLASVCQEDKEGSYGAAVLYWASMPTLLKKSNTLQTTFLSKYLPGWQE